MWQTSDDKTNLKNFQSTCASPLCELFLSFSLGQNTPFSILCFLAFYVLAAIHSQAFSTSTILSSTWPLHTSWFAAYLQAIFCPGSPPYSSLALFPGCWELHVPSHSLFSSHRDTEAMGSSAYRLECSKI